MTPTLDPNLNTALQSGTHGKKNHTLKIEKVQRAAARYVCNNYDQTSSVTLMLESLNWNSLHYRRIQSSLLYFYKIKNN